MLAIGRLADVARAASGWGHLGATIETEVPRRLRMTWAEFSRRSGLSLRTIYDLRKGGRSSYDPEVLGRLEAALRWHHGSVERVLQGRDPERVPDPNLARLHHVWDSLTPEAQALLADLAERSARR